MFCKTKSDGTKSRSWTFPDGTTCQSKYHDVDDTSYCISGRCEKFSCDNSTGNYYKIDPIFCPSRHSVASEESHRWNSIAMHKHPYYSTPRTRDYKNIFGPTTIRSKYENGAYKINDFEALSQLKTLLIYRSGSS